MSDNIVVKGNWGTIEYAIKRNGKRPAEKFLGSLVKEDRSKLSHPLEKMANEGIVRNPQQFRCLGDKIFEFKSGQVRLLCFQRGNSWILTHGFIKKQDKTRRKEIKKARAIMEEHLKVIAGKGR